MTIIWNSSNKLKRGHKTTMVTGCFNEQIWRWCSFCFNFFLLPRLLMVLRATGEGRGSPLLLYHTSTHSQTFRHLFACIWEFCCMFTAICFLKTNVAFSPNVNISFQLSIYWVIFWNLENLFSYCCNTLPFS